MSKKPRIICDLSYYRSLYMDGQKLFGVHSFAISYDAAKEVTEVTIKMVIANDSLRITEDSISFGQAKICSL